VAAIGNEYKTLLHNKTWLLVPPQKGRTSLIANGFIRRRGKQMAQLIGTRLVLLQRAITNGMKLIMRILLVLLSRQPLFVLSYL
jgi:hypothetical protein